MLNLLRRFTSTFSQQKRHILIHATLTAESLAAEMRVPLPEVLSVFQALEQNPHLALNDPIPQSTAELLTYEFGCAPALQEAAHSRPPIVTIMGHVDHGKTTLLDSLRGSNLCAGEYGGITQGVGAFSVSTAQGKITFIDTPGHAAFANMRARGAALTDIVVLVVCSAEGVRPQTVECISHARSCNVPIIVALNKVDLPTANVGKVELELLEAGLELDKFGGDTLHVHISAKDKLGLKELEEILLFQAELMDLSAKTKGTAQGRVIESTHKEGKGNTCSALVQTGALARGDFLVAGCTYGRVKQMLNEYGDSVATAYPSDAVELTGLKELPVPGDEFLVVNCLAKAKALAERRAYKREMATSTDEFTVVLPKLTFRERVALRSRDTSRIVQRLQKEASKLELNGLQDSVFANMAKKTELPVNEQIKGISEIFCEKEERALNVILKAQNAGMLEAVEQAVNALGGHCKINIVSKGLGTVKPEELELAEEFSCTVFCIDVKLPKNIAQRANKANVAVRSHKVIYHLLEDLKDLISDFTGPAEVEEITGKATVKSLFDIKTGKNNNSTVAGLEITEGKLLAKCKVRVTRAGAVVAEGLSIESLRRLKEQVKEVPKGHECGLALEGFSGFVPGDEVIAYLSRKRREVFRSAE